MRREQNSRGKRSHEDQGNWETVRNDLEDLFATHHRRGVCSSGVLARAIGVSGASTVRRWLGGVHHPSPVMQGRIDAWVLGQRVRLEQEGVILEPEGRNL